MLAPEPQAAVLGQGKLSQRSCSCSVLGGILWREWLLLAGAELQGGVGEQPAPPRAAVLTAGCRPAWPGGTQGMGTVQGRDTERRPWWPRVCRRKRQQTRSRARSWARADRKALGCAAQGGLADKAAVAQSRKDPVPFLPSVVSQGLLLCLGSRGVIACPRWGWEWEATN